MPSIVFKSASLASNRLALTEQSVIEQATGLVSVSVQYVTTTANRDSLARQFYQDSPPPIYPTMVNRDELQSRTLFLQNRSIGQQHGIVTIKATYAGALLRALARPSVTLSRESKYASFQVVAYYYQAYGNYGGTDQAFLGSYGAYDIYTAQLTCGVKEYSIASVGEFENIIQPPTVADLLLGCVLSKPIRLLGDGRAATTEYDPNAPAKDLVAKYANLSVASDISYDFATPTVKVKKSRFFLEVPN
jgi:hypothetical protein